MACRPEGVGNSDVEHLVELQFQVVRHERFLTQNAQEMILHIAPLL